MPLFMIDCTFKSFIDSHRVYNVLYKLLRPTPNIFTAAAQKRDLHSRGAEPGIEPGPKFLT
jgi:hypothetical protein